MKKKGDFSVTIQPVLFRLNVALIVSCIIIVTAFTIFTPPPHTAMYVSFSIFAFIPLTLVALAIKTFRVKVEGSRVYIRKLSGFTNYNVDVSEITAVDLTSSDPNFREIDIITIHTNNGKKVNVGILVENKDKLAQFLLNNVEDEKINKISVSED
ncbi:MAG: hypothetical protein PUC65_05335 [Clostridiales bacterium]|nr:hypothetical protein [Clostridiales bacterium]